MNLLEEIKMQIAQLNMWTKAYDEGHPMVSDRQWDDAYFRLAELERNSGIYLPNSPTQKVVYEVKTELQKVTHSHPMLSLDKTKDIEVIKTFMGNVPGIAMLKMDGLTCSLTYKTGCLVKAETRGDGEIGEDVTHNAMTILSIPKILEAPIDIVVDGEIICKYDDFENFKNEYKNPRNFASGSIRLLDANECAKRKLTFVAWDWIEGFKNETYLSEKLDSLTMLGFTTVPYYTWQNNTSLDYNWTMERLKEEAVAKHYPIDGLVFKYDNCETFKLQGRTDHHFKGGLAFKFYDETVQARLRTIKWQVGRSGVLTPIACFDPIELEGTTVERASLHNYSIMRETLGPCAYVGEPLQVYKANQIIPQILIVDDEWRYDYGYVVSHAGVSANDEPEFCPCCGGAISRQVSESGVENYYCENVYCEGRIGERIEHWCSKKGLDIKGISEATIDFLLDKGWVSAIADLYNLKRWREEWIHSDGWGSVSVDKILDSIEESRTCDFLDFLGALGIPLIGKTVAKDIVEHFFDYDTFREALDNDYDFTKWDNWGDAKNSALYDFNWDEADELAMYININPYKPIETKDNLKGKTFVITGKLKLYKKRDDLKAEIESLGGKVGSSITAKTDYLIANQPEDTSKYKNAVAKGIPIITEDEYKQMI